MRLATIALAMLLTCLAGLAPARASADHWIVAPEQSRIGFGYIRNGQPAEGSFATFTGEGRFDPAKPEATTLELRIETASIDLGDAVESAFATSAEWFDSANHPLAVYRLTGLKPQGEGQYRAHGVMLIRGYEVPVDAPVQIDVGADAAHASGSVTLDRLDYMLGFGPSALFVDIGRQVAVRFELTALPHR